MSRCLLRCSQDLIRSTRQRSALPVCPLPRCCCCLLGCLRFSLCSLEPCSTLQQHPAAIFRSHSSMAAAAAGGRLVPLSGAPMPPAQSASAWLCGRAPISTFILRLWSCQSQGAQEARPHVSSSRRLTLTMTTHFSRRGGSGSSAAASAARSSCCMGEACKLERDREQQVQLTSPCCARGPPAPSRW